MLTIVVSDHNLQPTVDVIIRINQTGTPATARSSSPAILDAARVRTGEKGNCAILEEGEVIPAVNGATEDPRQPPPRPCPRGGPRMSAHQLSDPKALRADLTSRYPAKVARKRARHIVENRKGRTPEIEANVRTVPGHHQPARLHLRGVQGRHPRPHPRRAVHHPRARSAAATTPGSRGATRRDRRATPTPTT